MTKVVMLTQMKRVLFAVLCVSASVCMKHLTKAIQKSQTQKDSHVTTIVPISKISSGFAAFFPPSQFNATLA